MSLGSINRVLMRGNVFYVEVVVELELLEFVFFGVVVCRGGRGVWVFL